MAINWSGEISRRSLLSGAACAAGAAVVLGTTMTAKAGKLPQKAAGYQSSPKGGQRCDNCSLFQPASSCRAVDGAISPQGWCQLYVKRG